MLSRETGRDVEMMAGDLTNSVDLAKLEKIFREDSRVTLLVNNAGLGATAPLMKSNIADMKRMIALNVETRTRLTYAVILSETETFVVDESWLKRESPDASRPREGLSALADREVEMIEAALAESHGRIAGPAGAAGKLGIPRPTLESKIKRLGIDKYGQNR